jgi:hypothetical protein
MIAEAKHKKTAHFAEKESHFDSKLWNHSELVSDYSGCVEVDNREKKEWAKLPYIVPWQMWER